MPVQAPSVAQVTCAVCTGPANGAQAPWPPYARTPQKRLRTYTPANEAANRPQYRVNALVERPQVAPGDQVAEGGRPERDHDRAEEHNPDHREDHGQNRNPGKPPLHCN